MNRQTRTFIWGLFLTVFFSVVIYLHLDTIDKQHISFLDAFWGAIYTWSFIIGLRKIFNTTD